jgi:hypothetical protein
LTTAQEIAALEAAESKVASQSADGVSESNRSAADLIALSRYRRSLQSEAAGGLGFVVRQIVPSGAVR